MDERQLKSKNATELKTDDWRSVAPRKIKKLNIK